MVIQGETEGETFTSHVGEGFCVWPLATRSCLQSERGITPSQFTFPSRRFRCSACLNLARIDWLKAGTRGAMWFSSKAETGDKPGDKSARALQPAMGSESETQKRPQMLIHITSYDIYLSIFIYMCSFIHLFLLFEESFEEPECGAMDRRGHEVRLCQEPFASMFLFE